MSVINRQDLISDDGFRWPDEYAKKLEKLATESKKIGQGGARKGASELEKVQKSLARATEQSTKEFIDQKAALDKVRKSNREAVKDVNALDDSYDKLSRELEKNRKAWKNLAASGQANTKQARALKAEVKKLDNQLKKIDGSVGQNQRSVGKYSNALQGLGVNFLGVVGGITAFISVLRSGFTILRNYTKANSTLNAVLGVTSKQTKALRIQQKQLGESTAFSASEVAKAQTELARLGKTQEQIISLTPDILNAAVSFGVDLADAAELVAGQLNAFNLAAEEGQRVTDVLVKSTQISAFNFERLKTSLSIVSPAANAVNASIEDTIAVLSSAVDANIDASTAATGLRNIYIDLADKGITWDDAMQKINSSTDKLSVANELFGKRGAVVATVIADNTDKIKANTVALEGANGAAKEFADETLKNLDGALTLLNSAWEGLILSFEDGEGIITRLATAFINLATSTLTAFTQVNKFTASDQLGFWDKLGTLLGLASGNMQAVAASAGKIVATNASAQIQEMADALKNVTDSGADKTLKDVAASTGKVKEELKELPDIINQFYEEEKTAWLRLVESQKEGIDLRKGLEQKLADDLRKINKKLRDDEKAAKDKELEDDKERQELRRELIYESLAASAEIFTQFADLRIQQIGQEIEAVEFARNRDLEASDQTERSKFEINKKYDDERKKLEAKQLIAQKTSSLFQIAINTAVAITKSIAQLGLPLAAPFVALSAAIGAAQAGAVIAQQPPQFDEGTESTPKEYIAGEKRPEFRKDKKSGKWSLLTKPTLFKNNPRDTIVSGKETDSILSDMQDMTGANILNDRQLLLNLLNNDMRNEKPDNDLAFRIERKLDSVERTIKNKKEIDLFVSTQKVIAKERWRDRVITRRDKYFKI